MLDFGLAKAFASDEAEATVSNSPTLSMAATQQGVILGTAAYMSPEQAKGRTVDKRTDVWAFGCVLYEMLTGRQSFGSSDVTESLAAVIRSEPQWDTLPANLHPRLREAVERCLEKSVAKRFQDIGDVKVDIENVLADPSGVLVQPVAGVVQARPQSKLSWVATFALGLVIAGVAVWILKPEPPAEPHPVIRFSHLLGEEGFTRTGRPLVAISPDGTRLAYVANGQLYLRDLNESEARPIPGTNENPSSQVFSPDGEWLAFWSSENELKRIPVTGGTAVTLTAADQPFGTTWGRDGSIVYGESDGIWRVPETGGTPVLIVEAGEGEQIHGPQILPDGEHVLFTVTTDSGLSRWDEAQIVAESLETGERTVLWTGGSDARYVPTGHLVYALESDLFALRFDPETLTIEGGPVSIVAGTQRVPVPMFQTASAQYDVSENGTLVHVPGGASGGTLRLALLDRDGNPELLPVEARQFLFPRFSPDDTRVAVEIQDDDGTNIWIYDIEADILSQLTFAGGERPLWSPDGTAVIFSGEGGLWKIPSDFSGVDPEALPGTDVAGNEGPGSWSPDGEVLLFASSAGIHAWRRERTGGEGSETADVIVPTPEGFNHRNPEFSQDGNWFVYASIETGGTELYANPYPAGTGGRQRLTTGGGLAPVWVREGEEMIFQEPRSFTLQSMPIATDPSLIRGNPVELFPEAGTGANFEFFNRRNYDVTADGQRFIAAIVTGAVDDETLLSQRINIVLNWFEELKERVPVP